MFNLIVNLISKYPKKFEWTIYATIGIYLIFMIVAPLLTALDKPHSWEYLQLVWERWQTLNAAIIAFIASCFVVFAAIYNSEKEKRRNYIAAKAFIPDAIRLLNAYLKDSVENIKQLQIATNPKPELAIPDSYYQEVFKGCLNHAPKDITEYIVNLLNLLQIYQSRIHKAHKQKEEVLHSHYFYETYLQASKIKSLNDRLLRYARGQKPLNSQSFTLNEIESSIRHLKINSELGSEYDIYLEYITRILNNNSKITIS